MRALVADDNPTMRLIVTVQAAACGLRVDDAEDGFDALAKLDSAAEGGDPYAIVILDMQMPAMDGIELAHRISLSPTLGSPGLIMLTSSGGRLSNRDKDMFAALLRKPVRQAELYDAIVGASDG